MDLAVFVVLQADGAVEEFLGERVLGRLRRKLEVERHRRRPARRRSHEPRGLVAAPPQGATWIIRGRGDAAATTWIVRGRSRGEPLGAHARSPGYGVARTRRRRGVPRPRVPSGFASRSNIRSRGEPLPAPRTIHLGPRGGAALSGVARIADGRLRLRSSAGGEIDDSPADDASADASRGSNTRAPIDADLARSGAAARSRRPRGLKASHTV